MTVPSAPFCLSADVAPYMSLRINNRDDFEDNVTGVKKTSVDTFIESVSAQILARFRRAGYITPLVALSGVDWPSDQTDFLKMVCVMGACSIITSPLVANPGRKGGDTNPFDKIYQDGLNEIYRRDGKYETAGPFYGCQYRSRSLAERLVGEPAVPMTSYLANMYDPSMHTSFTYWTNKVQEYIDYIEAYEQPLHNYIYALNDANKGPYV